MLFKKKLRSSVVFILLLVISCSREATYTEEVIDGVRHVHNITPKWGDDVKVELEFVLQYGDLMAEDEDYQFYRPIDVNIDSDGNLYILDSGNFQVKKFDRKGNFINSWGNKGQGPGEFGFSSKIEIDRDDKIYVGDEGNRVVNIYDTEGNYFDRINYKNVAPQKMIILENGNVAANFQNFVIGGKESPPTIVSVIDREGNLITEMINRKEYDDGLMPVLGNIIYMTKNANDDLWVTFLGQNRIEKYSSTGDMLLKIDRILDYDESETAEMKEVTGSDGENFFTMDFNNFSTNIQLDHKNRIWVLTKMRQRLPEDAEKRKNNEPVADSAIEIFDEEGILLGRLTDPQFTDRKQFRIIGDRFFLIDNIQEMVVQEYKIVEK